MSGSEFKFSDLIKPGEGSRQALQRELEKRKANDDKRFKWEPGYVYSGAADLLLRHGTFFSGRQLPDQYERGAPTRCFENALELAEAHPELRYYQGVYMVSGTALAHAWCADDGGIIEVTFYTTAHDEHGRLITCQPSTGGRGSIPWVPPHQWAYCGVEFDPAWAREFFDHHGGYQLSILDPRHMDAAASRTSTISRAMDDWIFRHSYSRTGVRPLPEYTPLSFADLVDDIWDDEEEDPEWA